MSLLDLKLRRDLRHLLGPMVTIGLVMACGMAAFVAFLGTHASLVENHLDYYREARFADVFAPLRRAPERLEPRLAALPGVAALETRLVAEVPLTVPGMVEPASAHLVSLPFQGEPGLNRLHLRSGHLPGREAVQEVLVSEGFALVHRLKPGDPLTVLLNGRQGRVRVAGVALSPEFLFALPGGDPIPDDRHFAILWMPRRGMEEAFDLAGAFNDVVLTLAPGAEEAPVIAEVDRLLEPYGGLGAHGREDQASHRYVRDEIAQLRTMATWLPAIFMGVAAFLIHVVMARLIATQREQIAALKALGFPDGPILRHYFKLAGLVGVFGIALGILLGAWMGSSLTTLYADYLHFPVTRHRLHAWHVGVAAAVSLAAVGGGAWGALRQVLDLRPAEALRPPVPPRFQAGRMDAWIEGLARSPRTRMVVRNLLRRPARNALSILGIALGVAILVVGFFWKDGLDELVRIHFGLAQRQHLTVTFTQPLRRGAPAELARLPGVLAVEPVRAVPVRLRAGHHHLLTALFGIAPEAGLRRVLDASNRPLIPPPSGLLISEPLARRLQVRPGDEVDVEVLEGERRRGRLPVASLTEEKLGTAAYLHLEALQRFLDDGRAVSACDLRLDSGATDRLYPRLKALPKVASVSAKAAALKTFLDTSAEWIRVFSLFLTGFAAVIAVGVVYNNLRIALAERAWELASLRVLGFTQGEVAALLLGEFAVQLLLALPLGCLLGHGLARALLWATATDIIRLPLVVSPATYLFACSVVVVAGLLSALGARRRMDRMDLVSVLKTRE
ncbi:MAG TPA: FtsX-like permease family protein [Holophagaceae bacterium]|nr:FtsX-like permease family protein [Holophagaceae bacterium]